MPCDCWKSALLASPVQEKPAPAGSIIKFLLQIYNNNRVIFKRFFIVEVLSIFLKPEMINEYIEIT